MDHQNQQYQQQPPPQPIIQNQKEKSQSINEKKSKNIIEGLSLARLWPEMKATEDMSPRHLNNLQRLLSKTAEYSPRKPVDGISRKQRLERAFRSARRESPASLYKPLTTRFTPIRRCRRCHGGWFSCHCEGGFHSRIVGVKGPKCKKEMKRLDGWIKHFREEKKEPFRLAHLLLGKAAFISDGVDGGFGGLEFPSTVQEFLHSDPPSW